MKQQKISSSSKPQQKRSQGSKKRGFAENNFAKNTRLQAIILAVFAIVLSVQTFAYDFTLDDIIVITDNRFVKEGVAGIPKIISTSTFDGNIKASEVKNTLSGGRYRPFSLVLFALEYQLFGGKPAGMHVLNVLWNAALVVVLFYTLRLILHEYVPPSSQHQRRLLDVFPLLPFLAAALFAAHPTHTEVVANIKSRDEIMCLLFALGALYYFVSYCRTGSAKELVFSAGGYALALLSKESAITFLFIMPFTAWFFVFKHQRGDDDKDAASTTNEAESQAFSVDWKRIGIALGAVVGIAIVFFSIRAQIVGFVDGRASTNIYDNPFLRATFAERYATPVAVLFRYIVSSVFPFTMAYDYSFNAIPLVGWTNWQVMVSIIVHGGLLFVAVWKLRERSIFSYCLWWYFATISIVANLAFSIGALMGDRFLFMPSVATTLMMVYGVFVLLNARSGTSVAQTAQVIQRTVMIVIAIAALYSVRTVMRNPAWASNMKLHEANVATFPESMRPRRIRASAFLEDAAKVSSIAERDQMLNQAYQDLWLCMGNELTADADVHFRLGQYHSLYFGRTDSAVYYYRKAMRLDTGVAGYQFYYYLNYGNKLMELKQLDSAEWHYNKAALYDMQKEMIYLNLGLIRLERKQYDEAIGLFQKSLAIAPQYENPQRALAIAQQQKALARQPSQQQLSQKTAQPSIK